jgi:hypothetical protein
LYLQYLAEMHKIAINFWTRGKVVPRFRLSQIFR